MSTAHAAPGRISQEIIGGSGQRYTLSMPLTREGSAPLVVSLHYGGPVTPWYGRGLLEAVVEPGLRELGAVIIAPDCPEQTWSACRAGVRRVVGHVREVHGLAAGCTVLTGYSKGGIGAWDLASQDPGDYAAVVVMAARAPAVELVAGWSLPVRVLHGEDDELFPVDAVAAAVARLEASGVDAQLQVLDGATHYDTHRFAAPLEALVPWIAARCDVR